MIMLMEVRRESGRLEDSSNDFDCASDGDDVRTCGFDSGNAGD